MKKLIIANWKMYYGPVKAGSWIRAFRRERLPKDMDIVVAVPHVSLAAARASLGRAAIPALAAQDCFWSEEGAYTGEISPGMLKEFVTDYCLLGHSERRAYLGETDEMVAKKVAAVQKAGIVPVICIGETEMQRKKGEAVKSVRAQVQVALSRLKNDSGAPAVFAYEPVWAIGTGRPCSPQAAKEMHAVIRSVLLKKFEKRAEEFRVIYGGSVDARNVAEYVTTTGIDGCLVGGASLDPRTFGLLCRAAHPG